MGALEFDFQVDNGSLEVKSNYRYNIVCMYVYLFSPYQKVTMCLH